MTVLDMNPATLPPAAKALYETMAARRKAKGEGFGGPYLALLNHPELARRIEELGFFLKFEGALPQPYALVHAILAKTMAWQAVPDDLQARAVAQWGREGLVEIVVLSGFYQMFAAINQGFGIEMTEDRGREGE